MRIESVRLANLASLVGEWFIPLNDPAYLESGIFVITGKTGSGKSTILDAICFALYQSTPRLEKDQVEKLISRSENMGFAEVIFLINGERYRSSFTIFRAGKTGKSQTSSYEILLENLTKGISYIDKPTSGKTKHRDEIEKITGMNFMQFRQSILLAQGEFAFFLTASPSQRADVLERLTDSAIYGKISEEIHRRFTLKEREIAMLQEKIDTFSSEEKSDDQSDLLQQLDDSLNFYQAELVSLQKEREELHLHDNNLLQWQRNLDKQNTLNQEHSQLDELMMVSTQKREQFLINYHAFQDFYMQEEIRLGELKELSSRYKSLHEIREAKIKRLTEHELHIKNLQEDSIKVKLDIEMLLVEESKFTQLLDDLRQNHNATLLEDSMTRGLLNLERIYDEWQLDEQFWSEGKNQENWQRKLFLEKELEQLDCDPVEKKSLENLLIYWKYNEEQKILSKELEQLRTEKEHMSKQLEKKKVDLKDANDQLFFLQQTVSFFEQRANLQLESHCPLCQQPVLNVPNWDENSENIAKKAVCTQEQIKHSLEQELAGISQKIGNITIECKHRENQLATISEESQRLEIDESMMKLSQSEADKCYQDFLTKEQHQDNLVAELQGLLHLEENMTRYQKLTDELALLLSDLESKSTILNQDISLEQRYLVLSEKYATEKKIASEIQKVERKLMDISFQIKEKNSTLEHANERLTFYQAELEILKEERLVLSGDLDNIKNKLIEEKVFDIEIGQLIDSLKQQKRDLDEEERISRSEYEQVNHKKNQLELQLLQQQNELSEIVNKAMLLNKETITNDFSFGEYQSFLDKSRSNHEQKLERVNKEYRELLEQRASVFIEQQNFLKQSHQLEVWGEEAIKLRNEYDLWCTMQKMIGSHDGKKFRAFAQAITLDQVVAIANDYLVHMQDRYVLQRDVSNKNEQEKLDFVVIDQFQGDVSRGIETLSGGERFLISLSLALGLAGLASEKVKVESFFLDEGFGVLDEDSLQTVLDALTSLRNIGKVVGLISHVEQLKERIEQKIVVKTKGNGKSEIIGLGVEHTDRKRSALKNRDLF